MDSATRGQATRPDDARASYHRLLDRMPGFVGVLTGPRHVYEYVNDAYVAISGPRDFIGRSVREVFPELAGQGFCERLDQVYASGERYAARALPMQLADTDELRFIDLNYEPIRDEDGAVTGIFIGGYDVTTTIRTASALAESEARYRRLLETTETGFCIIQMKFDSKDRPIDYMILEGNAAFEDMTGLKAATGKWVSEVAPGLEQHWYDTYGRVAQTGQPVRFENEAVIFSRWYDVQAARIGAPEDRRVAILFNDITAAKRTEWRQAALIKLSDALRDLNDVADIASESSRVLGEALGVDRVGYGIVDPVAETISIERDFHPMGTQSLAGIVRFRDYGSLIEQVREGQSTAVNDVAHDPRTRDTLAALNQIGVAATVNMPLVEQGRTVALIYLGHSTPRTWNDHELELTREFAQRVRSAVERARASIAVKEGRTELQRLTDNLPLLVAFVGADLRYQFANAAYLDWFEVDPEQLRGTAVIDLIGQEAFTLLKPRLDRALAGERVSSEQYVPYAKGGARHTRTEMIPRRDLTGAVDGYYAMIQDITDRKQAELRQAVLLDLNDAVRDLTDPAEIAQASARILAKALNVTRAGYGVMDVDAETITIDRDYNAAEVTSIAGVLQFRDFGSYIEDLKRGETVAIANTADDPRTQDTAEPLAEIGVASFVNMPLMEQGRVVALVFVNHVAPRVWSQGEIDLMREVAERVRASTERARASADLRESEARFRNMADNTPMMMWVTDPSGWCSYLNKTWYEFTGQSEGEAEGYGWLDATHPDDKARAEEVFLTANAAQAPFQVEYRLRRADGVYRWAIDAASPRFAASGEYLGYVGSVIDIDARREMEDALRASEAQLEVLLEGSKAELERLWELSPDLLTVVDYEGRLERINPSWTRVLGWDEHTLLTRPYVEILHPDEIEQIGELLATMRSSEQPVLLEDRLLAADGSWRSFVWTLSPEPGGERLYGVGRDVTEERARERELAIAQEALRQSQKMEAVGQLSGGIAHDFNNLLAGISGSLELLEKRMSQGRLAGVERYINGAQESARRAATLTQRLLAFSRRQTLDPKPTDVNRLIAGMEDLIRRTVGPNIEVEVVGAGGLWTTRIDPSQLENALLNLAINGRDAMAPHGGRLTIETANKWLDERASRERDLLPGQYISLCVTDTGTGMTPTVMSKAFEPFFTTKPMGQGTGLGLSMIHGFVRQSGGQVRIYSEVGQGTTMCLYLPRFADELEETDTIDIPHEADLGHGEVVLVIDDEATVRMLIVEVLQDAGYNVLEAEDGPSGLRILQSDTRIDLLITDVGLSGGMNGRQVADAARISRPDLKILFVTGYAENAAVGNGHLDPGMAVMTKPFSVTALGNKAREMIEE